MSLKSASGQGCLLLRYTEDTLNEIRLEGGWGERREEKEREVREGGKDVRKGEGGRGGEGRKEL